MGGGTSPGGSGGGGSGGVEMAEGKGEYKVSVRANLTNLPGRRSS